MADNKPVGLLFESWNDLDRVAAGLSHEEATETFDGGSSFAQTFAHAANQVNAWINVRFQGRQPHPLIGLHRFRVGGTGVADEWTAVQGGVGEVRDAARRYLENMTDEDLDLSIPYNGSVTSLRESGLVLRYAIMRSSAHHYFHIGEIVSKRDRLGHDVGDYPGLLEECI